MPRAALVIFASLLALGVLLSCRGIVAPEGAVAARKAPAPGEGIAKINHIVIMLQENRSFDSYFGKLGEYRVLNGLPADVDGLPADASNPADDGSIVRPFHLQTMCMENVTPAWNEAHGQTNRDDPSSDEYLMNGYVHTAAGLAQCCVIDAHDLKGVRAMGYYDWNDLPYYYFMATQFATSDRFFAPAPAKSEINRMYMMAATSNGNAITAQIARVRTIWSLLENAGVTWKIYVTDINTTKTGDLPGSTYLGLFFGDFAYLHADHIAPLSQYFSDVQNGTLPAVSFIESGYFSGRDEHPGGTTEENPNSATHVQVGTKYVSDIINALMFSPSWQDSVFFLSWDEWGGMYDHVPPMKVVSPDGIAPVDLGPTDAAGDFTRSGMRVPVIVVSPFAKKNYVSHTPMDFTAFLTFVETRFGLPSLTARDGSMPDMTEFFDFTNAAWATPPNPPAQRTDGPCYLDHLP